MVVYVSHCFGGKPENLKKAKKITHDLQVHDPDNCYICPVLAFSELKFGEMPEKEETEICIDLLSVSDRLIVASHLSKRMQKEIDFARRVHMEVLRLEKNGELRPYTD